MIGEFEGGPMEIRDFHREILYVHREIGYFRREILCFYRDFMEKSYDFVYLVNVNKKLWKIGVLYIDGKTLIKILWPSSIANCKCHYQSI